MDLWQPQPTKYFCMSDWWLVLAELFPSTTLSICSHVFFKLQYFSRTGPTGVTTQNTRVRNMSILTVVCNCQLVFFLLQNVPCHTEMRHSFSDTGSVIFLPFSVCFSVKKQCGRVCIDRPMTMSENVQLHKI